MKEIEKIRKRIFDFELDFGVKPNKIVLGENVYHNLVHKQNGVVVLYEGGRQAIFGVEIEIDYKNKNRIEVSRAMFFE